MAERKLRYGFTTGSCAAAAAKAGAYMLFTGGIKDSISIETPKGITFNAEIINIEKTWDRVKCGVVKDGGDDPDVTTGLVIYAEVSRNDDGHIRITGGDGVGLVTRPGLDQQVGNHAINSVPREMIETEVREVISFCDPDCGVDVIISAPGGDEVAKKTFNPRLGIQGGISILGTSGIVEPMSMEAIIETIKVELRQRKAEGNEIISVSPGNYGLEFMHREYGFDLDQSVKCSNFIGITWDMIKELEIKKVLLVGHSGKLSKVAGGIMNTHSKEADGRMEIIAAHSILKGLPLEDAKRILRSNTTDEAFSLLEEKGIMREVGDSMVERIMYYLDKRAQGEIQMECVMFSKELGLLGKSKGAEEYIEEIKRANNHG